MTRNTPEMLVISNPNPGGLKHLMTPNPKKKKRRGRRNTGLATAMQSNLSPNPRPRAKRRNPQKSWWDKTFGPVSNPAIDAQDMVRRVVKGALVIIGGAAVEGLAQLFMPQWDSTKFGAVAKRFGITFVVFEWVGRQFSPFASEYLAYGGYGVTAGIFVLPVVQPYLPGYASEEVNMESDNGVGAIYDRRAINPAAELGAIYPTGAINPAAEVDGRGGSYV